MNPREIGWLAFLPVSLALTLFVAGITHATGNMAGPVDAGSDFVPTAGQSQDLGDLDPSALDFGSSRFVRFVTRRRGTGAHLPVAPRPPLVLRVFRTVNGAAQPPQEYSLREGQVLNPIGEACLRGMRVGERRQCTYRSTRSDPSEHPRLRQILTRFDLELVSIGP